MPDESDSVIVAKEFQKAGAQFVNATGVPELKVIPARWPKYQLLNSPCEYPEYDRIRRKIPKLKNRVLFRFTPVDLT